MLRRLTCTALLGAMLLSSVTGCQSNPYSADTWIDKLDDAADAERAVTELEHLGDPKAIPALGKAWENGGCTQRLFQVMIDLARPLTPAEADKGNFVDLATTGRKASWDAVMPFLTETLRTSDAKCLFDEASPRSIENAGKAADALGDSQTEAGLQALIDALGQPYGPKGQVVRLSVILALGKYKDPKAVKALQGVLENSPESVQLPILAATVNALAEIKNPDSLPTLIATMYRVPPIFSQIRRALVAMGPGALSKLRAILRGEDQAVNALFKDQKLDLYCGDKDPAIGKIDKPITPCKPISMREFYAAIILGDMYSPEAVPDLLAALKKPAMPAFYQAGNPTGSTQHNGIYDSLRKIGSAEGADQLKAIWNDSKADAQERVLAIGAYAFVARGGAGVADLGKIVSSPGDNGLRQEAATAFARLATTEADIAVMAAQAALNQKSADEAQAKADGPPKAAYEKAKAVYDEAKKKLAAAKAKFNAEGGVKKASADTINAFTEAQKAADDADEPFDNAKLEWKPLDNAAKDYRGYQRLFETHIARIEIYLNCKSDPACYAKALDQKPDELKARLGKYIKGMDKWSPEELNAAIAAQVERALLELGKLGPAAEGQTGVLLAKAASEDRIVRQSVLLALPKIAKVPCPDCETKLDEAIKKSAGKSELAQLNVETTVLRNYFAWAGKK
ncbi:MAG: HEAT repeat domain-containing protein [Deltaproteobacteria bacterium]|nr:HEAT repeat domain-containing protein [Deltaproteobacteria bacterium]